MASTTATDLNTAIGKGAHAQPIGRGQVECGAQGFTQQFAGILFPIKSREQQAPATVARTKLDSIYPVTKLVVAGKWSSLLAATTLTQVSPFAQKGSALPTSGGRSFLPKPARWAGVVLPPQSA